jgi:Tfp pilus assembly protein PilE
MYRMGRGHGSSQQIRIEVGLNLSELLIVIVVLGICAVAVILSLGGVTSRGAVAACNADAAMVETAVGEFNAEIGSTSTLVTPALLTSAPSPYLKSFPSSPSYTISIVSGVVMVAAPKSSAPVAFGTANACANAGS